MDDSKVASCIIYDCNGEIIDNFDLKEGEMIKHFTNSQRESYHDVEGLRRFSNQMGGFVSMFYFNHKKLFDDGVITNRANIIRLMMLVTYMDYDSVLVDVDGEPLKPTQMMELLKLNKSTWSKFWKEVREADIIYKDKKKDEKVWKVSTEWFYRGQMKKCECNFIRVYINTVRKLYESNATSQKNHLALSYVIELIPHVHFITNFIVHDVTAHPNDIKFMTTQDICKFLGIDDSTSNVSKVAKDLKSLRFECTIKGKTKSCFLFNRILVDSNNGFKERGWMVNPMFVNSMSNIGDINKAINCLFVQE